MKTRTTDHRPEPSPRRRSRTALTFFLAALMGVTGACRVPRTYYDANGKPYTQMEEDPLTTLAAVALIAILVGAVAANRAAAEEEGNR